MDAKNNRCTGNHAQSDMTLAQKLLFTALLTLTNKFIKPTEDLVMPFQAVCRAVRKVLLEVNNDALPISVIQHPVILIGENHKTTRDTQSKQV